MDSLTESASSTWKYHFLSHKQTKIILCFIYLTVVGVILLRIFVESTHYTSPDSHFYLRVAKNLHDGKGLIASDERDYPFDDDSKESHFATWPAGYPVAIWVISKFTGTPVMLASKITNLLFLGLLFGVLYKWFGRYSILPALYFLSYGKLEVYSYTWSEGPFLFFVLWLCYIIKKDLAENRTRLLFLQIFSCTTGLFLFRYAGLIYFFFVVIFLFIHIYRRNYGRSVHYFVGLLLASILVLFYLRYNLLESGYYTGMDRLHPETESAAYFGGLWIKGIFNELMLARNYFFKGYSDPLFLTLLVIQAAVVVMLVFGRSLSIELFKKTDTKILFSCGVFYLIAVTILRKIQPFDPFDYRILSPFSTMVFIALFASLRQQNKRSILPGPFTLIALFMILSLAMNLPKRYLIDLLF